MMSNEVSSEETNEEYCKQMQECYPEIDLRRMLQGLLGVALVFVVAMVVL